MKMKRSSHNEPGPFTRYLSELERTGSTDEIDPKIAEDMVLGLCRMLQGLINRRCLWNQRTTYLGIDSAGTWNSVAGEAESWPSTPLRDLFHDFFVEISRKHMAKLVDQLRARRAKVGDTANVDGNIWIHGKNFIAKRQRENDPYGLRVYSILVRELQELDGRGAVHLSGEPGKISNSTIIQIGIVKGREGDAAKTARDHHTIAHLFETITAEWVDQLMPGLMQAAGRARSPIRAELRQCILNLPSQGVSSFRFDQLIQPLKHHVRTTMSSYESGLGDLEPEDEKFRLLYGNLSTLKEIEDRDSLEKIIECVEGRIDHIGSSNKRRQLSVLWGYFQEFALTRGLPELSAVKLGEALSMPRNNIPGHRTTLRRFLETCLEQLGLGHLVSKLRLRSEGGSHNA